MPRKTIAELESEIRALTDRIYALETKNSDREQVKVLAEAANESRENLMKTAGKEINKRIIESAAHFIGQVDKMVRERLEASIAEVLGFDRSWGQWRVDHCNGRETTINKYVTDKARLVVATKLEEIMSESNIATVIQEAKDAVLIELKAKIKWELESRMKSEIFRVYDKYVQVVATDVEKQLEKMTTDIDIANPNMDAIGEVVLKQFVESTQKLDVENAQSA